MRPDSLTHDCMVEHVFTGTVLGVENPLHFVDLFVWLKFRRSRMSVLPG